MTVILAKARIQGRQGRGFRLKACPVLDAGAGMTVGASPSPQPFLPAEAGPIEGEGVAQRFAKAGI